MQSVRAPASILASVLLAAGCRCQDEKPYTPFQIPSTALPTPGASGSGAAQAADAATPTAFRPADTLMAAGKRGRTWRLGGEQLTAPEGATFERAVRTDLDGDGTPETVAWTVPVGASGAEGGALWLYRGKGSPRRLMGIPSFVPTGPDCTLTADLRHTGPRTLTLEASSRCTTALIPRSPTRSLSVVAPLSDDPELLTLRLADPAPGERIDVALDTTDRDADGRDDIELSVTVRLEGEAEGATGRFVWLDRAAGLARETTEPKKGFEDLGSVEVVRAKGKNTSRTVPGRVEGALRLYSTLCGESGVARLFDAEGAPMACGDLRQAFAWYAEAELVSALTRKEPSRALGVILQDGWYGGPRTERTQRRLEDLLRGGVPAADAKEVAIDVVRARQPGGAPRWSPLRFTTDGALQVATVDGVAQLDLSDPSAEPIFDEADPWPQAIVDERGVRLTGAAFPCDRNEVVLLVSERDGTPLPSRPVGLLAARPGGCAGGAAPEPPVPIPLAWTGSRHEVAIVGQGARPLDEPGGRPGLPSSLALPSPLGLFVLHGEHAALWQVEDVGKLRDCVAAPDGKRVACVRGLSTVAVFSRS